MRYLAQGFEHYWDDEAVVSCVIRERDREEWSSLNPEFWWQITARPSLWDRLTRAARTHTFGRALGALLAGVALVGLLGLAGAVEGGW